MDLNLGLDLPLIRTVRVLSDGQIVALLQAETNRKPPLLLSILNIVYNLIHTTALVLKPSEKTHFVRYTRHILFLDTTATFKKKRDLLCANPRLVRLLCSLTDPEAAKDLK